MVSLAGHMVATAQVDEKSDEWWILDADFGVVIEHNIDEIEQQPEIISSFYHHQ